VEVDVLLDVWLLTPMHGHEPFPVVIAEHGCAWFRVIRHPPQVVRGVDILTEFALLNTPTSLKCTPSCSRVPYYIRANYSWASPK
jgi:hypothetical protein